MRDYTELSKSVHCCVGCEESQCEICPRGDTPFSYIECKRKLSDDAADAIEELLAENKEILYRVEIAENMIAFYQEGKPLPNVPKWISVEERLPEDQGDDARVARGGDYIHKVLAASVTPNYTVMDTAYLENGIWSLSQYTSWKQIIGAPVTHWMPLPLPPKEDAECKK